MRRFWIAYACAALVTAAPALATQTDPKRETPNPAAASAFANVMRSAWYNIADLIVASAAKMPEEHYTFRPTNDVRTFAQIVAHVAAEHYAACGPTIGRQPPAIRVDRLAAKKELVDALRQSVAMCDMAYGLLTEDNAAFRYPAFKGLYTRAALLIANITHDSEHYGNLVTYMRLKDVVPPSSAGVR